MRDERTIGGIACGEVLACLDAFVDGSLAPEDRERVIAHVGACDHCARFGGTYAAMIEHVRASARADQPDPAVLDRLTEKLAGMLPPGTSKAGA
jgi:anti-sigma factor RsiW